MAENHPPEWLYFQSKGSGVMLVGSNQPWDGLQAEIDFFRFHALRIGRAMDWGEPSKITYQADGGTFGFAFEDGACNGVYAAAKVAASEVLPELA